MILPRSVTVALWVVVTGILTMIFDVLLSTAFVVLIAGSLMDTLLKEMSRMCP